MRETPRSLGIYFSLIGIFYLFGAAFGLSALARFSELKVDAIMIGVSGGIALLGLAYLYVGVKLRSLLASRPAVPLRLAVLGLALSILRFNIFSILANIYIFYQLKRLATEAVEVTEGRTLG